MDREVGLSFVLLVSLAAFIPVLLTCGAEISPVVDDCKAYTEEGAVDIDFERSCCIPQLDGEGGLSKSVPRLR